MKTIQQKLEIGGGFMAEMIFAKQLQQLRKKKGVTQEQLAGVLGVSAQAVSKWENGSYPEGDLLPKLADYFEVTIDYLYGREKESMSFGQQVVTEMQKTEFYNDHGEGPGCYFEKMLDLMWAAQIAPWANPAEYYERKVYDTEKGVTVSMVHSDRGYSFMRLNKDLEYGFIMKEPEGGFAKRFKPKKELAELFAFFGDMDNLRIMFFLMTLNSMDCVEPEVVAKKLGIKTEKAEKALRHLIQYGKNNNPMIRDMQILDEKGNKKPLCAVNPSPISAFLTVLAAMDGFLNPPQSYYIQIGSRSKEWMREENEEDPKEEKKKN